MFHFHPVRQPPSHLLAHLSHPVPSTARCHHASRRIRLSRGIRRPGPFSYLFSDRRALTLGTSSACSHSSFEKRSGRHSFAWIANHAHPIHSSTLENQSGRSYSALSSVCLKYLSSSEPHLSHSLIGPYGAGVFDPRSWGNHKTETNITLELTRVVLAIGVFAIGVELPKAYMRQHWKSLMFLLIPVMTWVCGFSPPPSFDSHTLSLRAGSFPLGSFTPLSRNSTSFHLSPWPLASPRPTLFLLRPSWEENTPRSTSRFISDTSWQQSAVATTELHSPSCSSHYTSPPTKP